MAPLLNGSSESIAAAANKVVLTDSENDSRPYLSIVVTARNDDHGGNLLGRMQTFVNALIAQAKRHQVSTELVVVDWNPPPEKAPLIDALHWPSDLGPVEVRFIEVPADLHAKYRHGAALPLYQMIAKNVGIRRARGRFILATNIDVIFSHEMFEYFAAKCLTPGHMYRVDRYDTAQDVPVDASIDEQLEYCANHLIRINTRQGSFPVSPTGQRIMESNDIVSASSGICLGNGWYPLEGDSAEYFRWVLDDAEIYVGRADEGSALMLEVEPGPAVGFGPFALHVVDRMGLLLQEIIVTRRRIIRIEMASLPDPTVIRLRPLGGGLETAYDPRILNFRAFRIWWEHETAAVDGAGTAKGLASANHHGHAMGLPKRIWKTLSRLRTATGPVPVGVPLPSFVTRLNPRLEGNSLVLTVDRGARSRLAPETAASESQSGGFATMAGGKLVAADVDLLWGRNWYSPEFYKGEHFRWGRTGAELILCAPANGPKPLRIKIEPGPALGYGAFQLEVRDGSGKTVVTATVNRRQWIELPFSGAPRRSQVYSLHAQGTLPPRILRNDPRKLYFRILEIQWAAEPGTEAMPAGAAQHKVPWTPIASLPGLLLGNGWCPDRKPTRDQLTWIAETDAEIVVQGNRFSRDPLLLDLEPAGEGAVEVSIFEGDRSLGTRLLTQREEFSVAIRLEPEQATVLRLDIRDPHTDADKPGNRTIKLVRAAWWAFEPPPKRGPAIRTASSGPSIAVPATPIGAVYLHTNACGDFTLLAREHWFDLRAYPEFDLFSMNLDSVFCYAAHHGGAPELILPDPIRVYHIEHATGSGFTPEGQTKLFERIAAKGISWISYEQVLDWATEMRRFGMPLIFNREDWGLATIELSERRVRSQAGASS